MTLTTAQKQALKADILSHQDSADIYTNGDMSALADLYNAPASPDYWVFVTALTQADLQGRTSPDGTAFDWASAGGFISRSQGERDAYRTMFSPGSINPTMSSTRLAYADVFSGSGVGAVANRNHFNVLARRKASRCERLFAIDTPGSGAPRGTTADPDTLTVEGSLSFNDLIGL